MKDKSIKKKKTTPQMLSNIHHVCQKVHYLSPSITCLIHVFASSIIKSAFNALGLHLHHVLGFKNNIDL
jgi:hypothetical protein